MEEEQVLDFNFWPSFADLMLSLVLILVMIVFSISAVLTGYNYNLESVKKEQINTVDRIALAYEVTKKPMEQENQYGISTGKNNVYDIIITNETTFQNITFSDKVLFDSDAYVLKEDGRKALRRVGNAIKSKLKSIGEIQIQGHADIDASKTCEFNLELGARRAMEVFNFLQDEVKFDPVVNLMCITSYGEFKPVNRPEDDENKYSYINLWKDNETTELKDQNRRIELRLIYKH